MRPKRRGGPRNGEKRSGRGEMRGGRRERGPFIDVVCRTRYIGRAVPIAHRRSAAHRASFLRDRDCLARAALRTSESLNIAFENSPAFADIARAFFITDEILERLSLLRAEARRLMLPLNPWEILAD